MATPDVCNRHYRPMRCVQIHVSMASVNISSIPPAPITRSNTSAQALQAGNNNSSTLTTRGAESDLLRQKNCVPRARTGFRHILRATRGDDKQGFPTKHGILLPYRVKLLLSEGCSASRC
ncbi:hypothetical protein C8F04DRAFT_1063652 [Mycena alexandri]|uniref:Uncharacterized protein n=1 Tax=Mycena alexandri TaxID=1745969 RepID=A0AAD6X168_9AGAR|nr:hypothetical protein C8F04DRAFT_1119437 [Mycena alexandri]KAJ7046206.1 hypothetical protein C8F04DRAFT_1063652 [Mycena alexandri]